MILNFLSLFPEYLFLGLATFCFASFFRMQHFRQQSQGERLIIEENGERESNKK
jgi:hypothetical protein